MTASSAKCPAYLSPRGVADRLNVRVHCVLAWIANGELRAANVAVKRGGRPRWRVSAADLELFLAGRLAVTPTQARRRQRRMDPDLIEYFPNA